MVEMAEAVDSAQVRTHNTDISYDVELQIPAEYFDELDGFSQKQRLIDAIVKENHRDEFGQTHIGFNVGVVRIDELGSTVNVKAVVKA